MLIGKGKFQRTGRKITIFADIIEVLRKLTANVVKALMLYEYFLLAEANGNAVYKT